MAGRKTGHTNPSATATSESAGAAAAPPPEQHIVAPPTPHLLSNGQFTTTKPKKRASPATPQKTSAVRPVESPAVQHKDKKAATEKTNDGVTTGTTADSQTTDSKHDSTTRALDFGEVYSASTEDDAAIAAAMAEMEGTAKYMESVASKAKPTFSANGVSIGGNGNFNINGGNNVLNGNIVLGNGEAKAAGAPVPAPAPAVPGPQRSRQLERVLASRAAESEVKKAGPAAVAPPALSHKAKGVWAGESDTDPHTPHGARTAVIKAASERVHPTEAFVPLSVVQWEQKRATTSAGASEIFLRMTGFGFPPSLARIQQPFTLKAGKVNGLKSHAEIAAVLGDARAAALTGARYYGYVHMRFVDVVPLPAVEHPHMDEVFGAQHPQQVLDRARELMRNFVEAAKTGLNTAEVEPDAHGTPALRVLAHAPAHFSPSAVLVNSYVDAYMAQLKRPAIACGLFTATGKWQEADLKKLAAAVPMATLGTLPAYPNEVLWAAQTGPELDEALARHAAEGTVKIGVRMRKAQCPKCFGAEHTSGKKAGRCPGLKCGHCGSDACIRAGDSMLKCQNTDRQPTCAICDGITTVTHRPADCPAPAGVMVTLVAGAYAANTEVLRKIAKVMGGHEAYAAAKQSGKSLAGADKTFEQAAARNPARQMVNTSVEEAVRHAEVLIRGLSIGGLRPKSAVEGLAMADMLTGAAHAIAQCTRDTAPTAADEERAVRELEQQLEHAKARLKARRDAVDLLTGAQNAAAMRALHTLQQLAKDTPEPQATAPNKEAVQRTIQALPERSPYKEAGEAASALLLWATLPRPENANPMARAGMGPPPPQPQAIQNRAEAEPAAMAMAPPAQPLAPVPIAAQRQ